MTTIWISGTKCLVSKQYHFLNSPFFLNYLIHRGFILLDFPHASSKWNVLIFSHQRSFEFRIESWIFLALDLECMNLKDPLQQTALFLWVLIDMQRYNGKKILSKIVSSYVSCTSYSRRKRLLLPTGFIYKTPHLKRDVLDMSLKCIC